MKSKRAGSNVRPVYTSDFSVLADRIVVNWIERVNTPPANLSAIVQRYRDLRFFYEMVDETSTIEDEMTAIYNRLTIEASVPAVVAAARQVNAFTFMDRANAALAKRVL